MFHLYNGPEYFLIKKEIAKLISDLSIDEVNINNYDLTETNISEIIEDASMMSMFGDKKMIIVSNSEIFTSQENAINHNIDEFLAYMNNPNPNTIIVFTNLNEKLDERKKVTKKLKSIGVHKTFGTGSNISTIAKELLSGYEINDNDIKYLINRVSNNLELLSRECEKLILYKWEEKVITKKDIDSLVNKNIDLDIFNLIDFIITKNKEEAIERYYEMIKHGEEPIKLIVMLAGQIRLMYQTKELFKKGYTEKNIADSLNVHPYRVKLAAEKSRKYSSNDLLNALNNLATLDEEIKSGKTDKFVGFEMFILSL